eukprot:SAG31_NODE_1070_length_10071_cov_6.989771_3_plen_92_part_00
MLCGCIAWCLSKFQIVSCRSPVIVAGFGGFFGFVAGVSAWITWHLKADDEADAEGKIQHYRGLLHAVGRVRFCTDVVIGHVAFSTCPLQLM